MKKSIVICIWLLISSFIFSQDWEYLSGLPGEEFVMDAIIDSDNNLIILGREIDNINVTKESLIIKINPNGELLYINKYDGNLRFNRIQQIGNNYLIVGCSIEDDNGYILLIDKEGEVLNQSYLSIGPNTELTDLKCGSSDCLAFGYDRPIGNNPGDSKMVFAQINESGNLINVSETVFESDSVEIGPRSEVLIPFGNDRFAAALVFENRDSIIQFPIPNGENCFDLDAAFIVFDSNFQIVDSIYFGEMKGNEIVGRASHIRLGVNDFIYATEIDTVLCPGGNTSMAYVSRISTNGQKKWSFIQGNGFQRTNLFGMVQIPSMDSVYLGYLNRDNSILHFGYIIHLDASGNLLFQKDLPGQMKWGKIINSHDGHFYIVALRETIPGSNSSTDILVLKIDALGNVSTTSIKDFHPNQFNLYPNPNTGGFKIDGIDGIDDYSINGILFNQVGKQVWEGKILINQEFKIEGILPGYYVLSIGAWTTPLIITH